MDRIETEHWAPAQAECRALVAIEPAPASVDYAVTHRSAAFLAQLLAAKAGLPQTRERRRAEPDDAAHFYEQKMSSLPPRAGRLLSRAM